MARARNIKPGFFRSADLVEVSFQARLAFVGLWTLADRAGRLEDRPKQIKMELFPADDVDCNACLEELASIGVIDRYETTGGRFIQVVNFSKHQNPHRDEKASCIPGRDGSIEAPSARHGASTVRARFPADADSEAIGLIPDSRSLTPNTGILTPELAPQAPAALKAASQQRGSRLPESWTLPRSWGDWSLAEFPQWTPETVRTEAAKFADFWHAKTGKDATKANWQATWRNWCRNAKIGAPVRRVGPLTDEQRQAVNEHSTAEALRILNGRPAVHLETTNAH